MSAGFSTFCFKNVWKLREVLNVRVTAGTGGASWVRGAFSVLFKVTEVFCKIESKFLNSRVLAGGLVMGREKKSWF